MNFNSLTFNDVVDALYRLVEIAVLIAGWLMVIWGIWSGIKFMIAGGSTERQGDATKNFLWFLVGGLLLVLHCKIVSLFILILDAIWSGGITVQHICQ